VQKQIGSTIAGVELSTTVEGRERFPIRLRYARELRDNIHDLHNILVSTANGVPIPLGELADIEYRRGPQMIKSENTFLVSYVIFDKREGNAEVDVVERAQSYISEQIERGSLIIPAGVSYQFTGNYENQLRANQRLMLVIPVSLFLIILLLYLQFRSLTLSGFIFSGILVALSGGFVLIWLYGQPWFMDFSILGTSLRDLFQMRVVNLSVAVWVGFIALFGIATDDSVLISTYIRQLFDQRNPSSVAEIRQTILEAGAKRIRPAMMTTATTLIALLPVLTSTGKGSDIMIPMAIPMVGGMLMAVITVFVLPVCYSLWQEKKLEKTSTTEKAQQ
jgi:Cu(I)/Ag(I) efflux system membrane protein CusA/SilA